MKNLLATAMLICILIALSTIKGYSQDKPSIKRFDSTYVLVEKHFFVDIHRKATKFDSLSVLFYKRKEIHEQFKAKYDSMKQTFNLKLELERENNVTLSELNKKLKDSNDKALEKNREILKSYEDEVSKNKLLKKITVGATLISIITLILK